MGCGSSAGMNSARVQPAMYAPSTAPAFPNRGKAGARDAVGDSAKPAGVDAAGAVQAAGSRSLAHNGAAGYKSTSILSTSSTGLHSDSQRRRSMSRHQNGRGETEAAGPSVPLPGEIDSQRAATQEPNGLSPNPTTRSKKSKFQRPKALIDTSKAQAKAGRSVVPTVPEQEHRPTVRKSSDSTNLEHKSLQDYMGEQRKQAELYSAKGSPLRIDPSTPATGPVLGRGSSRFSLAGTTTASSMPSTPMTPLSNMTQPSPGAGGSVLEFMREKRIRSASLWKHRQESPAPGKNRLNAATPNG